VIVTKMNFDILVHPGSVRQCEEITALLSTRYPLVPVINLLSVIDCLDVPLTVFMEFDTTDEVRILFNEIVRLVDTISTEDSKL